MASSGDQAPGRVGGGRFSYQQRRKLLRPSETRCARSASPCKQQTSETLPSPQDVPTRSLPPIRCEEIRGRGMTDCSRLPKVIAGAPDRPLTIGSIEIPCYVLRDETRVLTRGEFLKALGRSRVPKAGKGGRGKVEALPFFLRAKQLKPFITRKLKSLAKPVFFLLGSGPPEKGYHAELLPHVCAVYLKARSAGALLPQQLPFAERAEFLLGGISPVGIIAQVDETSGYLAIRRRNAREEIIEEYVASDLQQWARAIPDEFFERMYELRNLDGPDGLKRPSVIGRCINEYVFEYLPGEVLDQLKRASSPPEEDRRRSQHHRLPQRETGLRELTNHACDVILLMRVSSNWREFDRLFHRVFKRPGDPLVGDQAPGMKLDEFQGREDKAERERPDVGIISPIDEASGNPAIRRREGRKIIIEKYVASDLRSWARAIPDEFFERMVELRKWDGPEGVKRPSAIGRCINKYVFEYLSQEALHNLKRASTTTEEDGRKGRHRRWPQGESGFGELSHHAHNVILLMRAASSWREFARLFHRAFKRPGDLLGLGSGPGEEARQNSGA